MKYRFLAIIALGQLIASLLANAELVQSSTSVNLTFRHCIAGETVCDSIGATQAGSYGGLPGDLAAQASQDEPAFGASRGSAELTEAPGAAELSASATSVPATRNGANSVMLQRYTNTGATAEMLTFGANLTYDQTVPAENASFPRGGPASSGTFAELGIFTMRGDYFEVGTTAEENFSALLSDPDPGIEFADLGFDSAGPASNVTASGTTALSKTVTVNRGDSVWLWALLQSFAANGAAVNASLSTKLESTSD